VDKELSQKKGGNPYQKDSKRESRSVYKQEKDQKKAPHEGRGKGEKYLLIQNKRMNQFNEPDKGQT